MLKYITLYSRSTISLNFWLSWFIDKFYHLYVGVEHVGGDMFECVPQGDAIFMKVSHTQCSHTRF